MVDPEQWEDHVGLACEGVRRMIKAMPWILIHASAEELLPYHFEIIDRCAKRFDKSLGFEFSTYAMRAMRNHRKEIANLVRGYKGANNWTHRTASEASTRVATGVDPFIAASNRDRDRCVADAIGQLPELHQRIVECVIKQGESLESFGRRYGLNKCVVHQAKNWAVDQLRNAIEKQITGDAA